MSQKKENPASPRREDSEWQVYWAAERTLLAWIRTGLAMMGFGFIVARFGIYLREMAMVHNEAEGDSPILSLWFGTALIGMGILVHAVSASQHYWFLRRFHRQEILYPRWISLGILVSLCLSALGIIMVTYLFVLRG